jgi:hypothetical protein
MKTLLLSGSLMMAGALFASAATQPPSPAPAAAPAPATAPDAGFPSVFVNDPATGKDPFFPRSTRRPLPKPVVAQPAEPVVKAPEFPESVQLKGVSLAAGKKLALIGNVTFAEGESGDVRIDGQVVRVQCIEIKDRSAIVAIKGIKRELQLRQGL